MSQPDLVKDNISIIGVSQVQILVFDKVYLINNISNLKSIFLELIFQIKHGA